MKSGAMVRNTWKPIPPWRSDNGLSVFVPILYRDPAFDAFDDFRGFVEK
jgi:hypothetical protein